MIPLCEEVRIQLPYMKEKKKMETHEYVWQLV